MAAPTLSSPITLTNGVVLPNRLAKAAMAENMAPKSNLPDENFKRVYADWAAGGWGLVMTGNVQIDPAHLGGPQDISVDHAKLHDAAYLKAWKEWADASTGNGTVTIVQINHPGRQSPMGAGNRGLMAKALAPSPIPLNFGPGVIAWLLRALLFGTPKEMSIEEIEVVIQQFVEAGKLAYDSGFQGIEIHGAHGYLLGLSSSSIPMLTSADGDNSSVHVFTDQQANRCIRRLCIKTS